MEPITINYRIELEDYLKALNLCQNPRRVGFKVIVLLLILGAIVLLINVFSERKDNWSPWEFAACWTVTTGILGGALLVLIPWNQRRLQKRLFDQHKALREEVTTVISEEDLRGHNALGDSRRPWDMFFRWKSDEAMIVLFEADNLIHIYPRRAFASEAEWQAFRELVTLKIGPEGKARREK